MSPRVEGWRRPETRGSLVNFFFFLVSIFLCVFLILFVVLFENTRANKRPVVYLVGH